MLKARLSNGDLVLGITDENVRRLKEGKPIRVNHAEVGDTQGDIYILHGETDGVLVEAIYEAFPIGDN